MRRHLAVLVSIGVLVAGCSLLSPNGTVSVDRKEYVEGARQVKSLVTEATDLLVDKTGGDDPEVGSVRSGRCDEAYAETLRQFEVNASTIVTRSVYRKDIDQLMSAGLAARGWKPGKNGYFTHPVRGGATWLLLVTVSQDTEDPDVYIAGLSISSTCMRVPESLVDRF